MKKKIVFGVLGLLLVALILESELLFGAAAKCTATARCSNGAIITCSGNSICASEPGAVNCDGNWASCSGQ